MELRHGYTMADIGRMARMAAASDRALSTDAAAKFDVAWSAIAEHLCKAADPPAWQDLVRVGWQAIYAELAQMRHTFSLVRHEPKHMPNAVKFWFLPPGDAEDEHVERLAVGQILAVMSEKDREALAALAVHGNYQLAADSLGVHYRAFVQRISLARRVFRRHWFAPDAAPAIRGTDRRVGAYGKPRQTHCVRGHARSSANVSKRGACRICEQQRNARRYVRAAPVSVPYPAQEGER